MALAQHVHIIAVDVRDATMDLSLVQPLAGHVPVTTIQGDDGCGEASKRTAVEKMHFPWTAPTAATPRAGATRRATAVSCIG